MNEWMVRYESLTQRERLLLVVSLLVVTYILFSFLVFGSLDSEQNTQEKKLQQLDQQEEQMKSELQLFTRLLNTDPDKAKKQQVRALEAQMGKIESSLTRLSVGLIPAEELPQLLKRVLQKTQTVTLQSIKTLPVSELSLSGEVVKEADSSELASLSNDDSAGAYERELEPEVETAGVYKHSVELMLTGSYFDIKRYVEALEALPWRLYWDSLEYSVASYPKASVELRVYTLSTDKGAFGEQ
tara:strand:- start:4775 stop:5500 length:726 start_codon:yes stop_codon:yes gene_type:complete